MTDVILIVLGNSNPETLKKRVNLAIEFYFKSENINKNVKIIFTGHNNEGVNMAKIASLRIPSNIVFVESNAKNTYENIVNSYNFIKQMNVSTNMFHFKPKIIICTSTYHVKRAVVIGNLIFHESDFKVEFFHTNENVSQVEDQREVKLLDTFLDFYLGLVEYIE